MSTAIHKQIPLLDLRAQHGQIRAEVMEAIRRVVESQQFILGPDVRELEAEIAFYCGARFAVGCASGSDAVFLALLAAGVGPGDEVLTTPYTFFATAGAIVRAGAIPVFADIDPASFNLNVSALEAVLDRHPNVRAIIPVHLFGSCADMDPILALAGSRGIPVIEDAAQAIGSEYKGRRAGSMSEVGCFSFFPSKNLGGFGDGGMLTTNDEQLAQRLAALRVHGSRRKYYHEEVGVNSRLDTLQAAVLRVKLRHLDSWTAARQANAEHYRRRLAELEVPVVLPAQCSHDTRPIYNQFVIRSARRNNLQTYLREQGIGTEIYYPLPLHLQECFEYLGYRRGSLPESERAAEESLALPIYPELTASDLDFVCAALHRFHSA